MKHISVTYHRPAQLAQRWSFATESVRRIIRQGRLPAVRIGKRLLVADSDVEAFENSHKVWASRGEVL